MGEKMSNYVSQFIESFSVLKISSQDAVSNGNSELSDDKNYFHVERPIEIDLIERLEKIKQLSKPQVLFLCGNVGDGKSHLLSYIKTNRPDLLENTDIHNDATESFSPEETALDTLYNVLGKFKDDVDERANSKKHLIIAINMGVLHKFIYDEKIRKDYRDICNFVHESDLFNENKAVSGYHNQNKHIISLLDNQLYTIKNGKLKSVFFEELLLKITQKSSNNSIRNAWEKDREMGINNIEHKNFQILMDESIRSNIMNSILEAIFKEKIILSVRSFLNFIHEIVIPDSLEIEENKCLPQLLFNQLGKSELLDALYTLDPAKKRRREYDEVLSNFIVDTNYTNMIQTYIENEEMINCYWKDEEKIQKNVASLLGFLIRSVYLSKKEQEPTYFTDFIKTLFGSLTGNEQIAEKFIELLKKVKLELYGEGFKQFVFDYRQNTNYVIGFDISHFTVTGIEQFNAYPNKIELNKFNTSIKVVYEYEKSDDNYVIEIDYPLYEFLCKVKMGYRPNRKVQAEMTKFTGFIDKLMDNYPNDKNVYILNRETRYLMEINEKKSLFSATNNIPKLTAKESQ